ncbi:MAG: HIRAN domain-containing protein [Steroidobacteraceae bacterium]
MADGVLTPRELEALRAWLERSGEVEVPSRTFVRGVIEHILARGRIAPADLQALGRALEPSLPAPLRHRPTALRLVGNDWMPDADENATERARNGILASAWFMVASGPGGRRTPAVPHSARAGEPVLLVRERESRGSRGENAIEVRTANGKPLGYVPSHRAGELAPLLDRGARYRAHLISVSSGVHAPVLIVQAFFYRGDAVLGFLHAGSRRIAPRRLSPRAWMVVRLAIALLIAAAVALALRA